jgi:hypothetical protein
MINPIRGIKFFQLHPWAAVPIFIPSGLLLSSYSVTLLAQFIGNMVPGQEWRMVSCVLVVLSGLFLVAIGILLPFRHYSTNVRKKSHIQ